MALVSFETIAMRDMVVATHHSAPMFGITRVSSYCGAKETGLKIRHQCSVHADPLLCVTEAHMCNTDPHMCRVLPAAAPGGCSSYSTLEWVLQLQHTRVGAPVTAHKSGCSSYSTQEWVLQLQHTRVGAPFTAH